MVLHIRCSQADLEDKRGINRNRRRNDDRLPLVCLVGYTNAGKTSLLNALSEAAEPLRVRRADFPFTNRGAAAAAIVRGDESSPRL